MDMESMGNDELYSIVNTSKDKNVRIEAIRRITDKRMLIDILLNFTQIIMKKNGH